MSSGLAVVAARISKGDEEMGRILASSEAAVLYDEMQLLLTQANALPDDQHEDLLETLEAIEAGATPMPEQTVDLLGQMRRVLEACRLLRDRGGQ